MRYGTALLAFLLAWGVCLASAEVRLSDEEMDQVSAQGLSIAPFVVSATTSTNTFIPVSVNTITSTNNTTITNVAVQICTFSVCLGPEPTITSANSSQNTPTIAAPQINTFQNSLQSPTLANFGFPSAGTPSFQVPIVQVPTIKVPSVTIQFP